MRSYGRGKPQPAGLAGARFSEALAALTIGCQVAK